MYSLSHLVHHGAHYRELNQNRQVRRVSRVVIDDGAEGHHNGEDNGGVYETVKAPKDEALGERGLGWRGGRGGLAFGVVRRLRGRYRGALWMVPREGNIVRRRVLGLRLKGRVQVSVEAHLGWKEELHEPACGHSYRQASPKRPHEAGEKGSRGFTPQYVLKLGEAMTSSVDRRCAAFGDTRLLSTVASRGKEGEVWVMFLELKFSGVDNYTERGSSRGEA